MKFIIIAILIPFVSSFYSQPSSDLNLLIHHKIEDTTLVKKRVVSYAFKDKNWFVKYNPVSLVFGGGLFFYQKLISPQIVMGCAFDPSCSNFSKGCIKEYGVIKGVALSTDRLTRCTRLSAIDFHPVLFNENGKVNDQPAFYQLRSQK